MPPLRRSLSALLIVVLLEVAAAQADSATPEAAGAPVATGDPQAAAATVRRESPPPGNGGSGVMSADARAARSGPRSGPESGDGGSRLRPFTHVDAKLPDVAPANGFTSRFWTVPSQWVRLAVTLAPRLQACAVMSQFTAQLYVDRHITVFLPWASSFQVAGPTAVRACGAHLGECAKPFVHARARLLTPFRLTSPTAGLFNCGFDPNFYSLANAVLTLPIARVPYDATLPFTASEIRTKNVTYGYGCCTLRLGSASFFVGWG
jgi:hypothetical protein